MREALESEYRSENCSKAWLFEPVFRFLSDSNNQKGLHVSMNINHWIDLIFGYKQYGPNAVSNYVLFLVDYEFAFGLLSVSDSVAH